MKVYNYIMLTAMTMMVFACADAVEPTSTNMAFGNWTVDEYYVNGQSDGSGILTRFTLERDNSFLMENSLSILSVGTWETTDTALTLTASDSTVLTYTIVFQSYTKMQLLQSFTSPTAGPIEIRYLMNNGSAATY